MTLAFVFPGQGSQSVGMLAALAAAEPVVQQTFEEASGVLGYDLWSLCQQGPEAELGATEKTQPAMLAAGVATWRVWLQHGGPMPVAMAGHSLGEYTALVCSQALDFRVAVDLVRFRGRAMQSAVPLGEGAMAAVLGLDEVELAAACREAAQGQVVEPVNFNAPGQVVIAGHAAAVARAIEAAKDAWREARHGASCQRAVAQQPDDRCRGPARRTPGRRSTLRCPASLPSTPWTCRRTAVRTGIRRALREQLFKPVRWADTVRAMIASGVTTFIECGPGKVLTSLGKRIERRPELRMLAIDDPDSLAAALAAARENQHA